MKLIHLSDLHLGKRVNEFTMIEDQKYILEQILEISDRERPDGVLIAGDVYDKPVPSAEAVQLFDGFLCALAERKLRVFIISGNHDSAERIAFGAKLMNASGIHLSQVYSGRVEPVVLEDEAGPVHFWLLPFLKPAHVRRFYPEAEIETYTDALRTAVEGFSVDPSQRNVLLTHQFVTGAGRSDSEEISVGGSDNVDRAVFDAFDYVALGHIHRPQNMGDAECQGGAERIRYCGTPLKYSFSEAGHEKSVTVVELGTKTGEGYADLAVRTVPLKPLHDLREIRGTYMEVTDRNFYLETATDDYLHITLTDEEDVPDAMGKLRIIYPNLMKLDYDNTRTRTSQTLTAAEQVETRSPLDLFGEFYEKQNNQPMSSEQESLVRQLIEEIWEGEA